MPLTVSTSARDLRAFGASHLLLYQLADLLADGRFRDLERQQALRPDGRLDLVVGDQRRRSAEVAALRDALRIEHRDRLAALALHAAALGLPAAVGVGDLAERANEIELLDRAGLRDLVRRFGAAERADQLLLARVPLGLRAAGRAGVLFVG